MASKSSKKKQAEQLKRNRLQMEQSFASVAGFLVLSLFIVHPLMITSQSYYNITETKLVTFLILLGLTVLSLVTLAVIAGVTVPDYFPRRSPKQVFCSLRPYEYAMLAYLLVLLVSTVLSDNPRMALLGSTNRNEGLLVQSCYMLTAAIVARLYRPKERDLLIFCAIAALVAFYGFFQYHGLDFLHLYLEGMNGAPGPGMQYFSTMSNRNVLSSYLVMAFSVCVVLFAQLEKRRRWAYLGMGWVIFYVLLLGSTESGYVGVAVAVALLFPLLAKTWRAAAHLLFFFSGCGALLWICGVTHAKYGWAFDFHMLTPYCLPAAAVLLLAAAALYFLRLPSLPVKAYRIAWYALLVVVIISTIVALPILAEKLENPTLQEAADMLDGNFDDSIGSYRMFIWKRSLQLVADRPILGYGPDNFQLAFEDRFWGEGPEYYDKAHNEYLQILVDTGALGLAAVLSVYGLLLWSIRKRLREPLPLAVMLGMVAFLVQAFFNISTPFAHPVAWAMWGVLGALAFRWDGSETNIAV